MGTPARSPLTQKHHDAIGLILDGVSLCAIAESLGIRRETLLRWRSRADFKAAMRAAAMDRWRDATMEAIASKPLAVRVLRDLAGDDSIPSAVRKSAAADLARLGDSGMVAIEFSERLAALEGGEQDD